MTGPTRSAESRVGTAHRGLNPRAGHCPPTHYDRTYAPPHRCAGQSAKNNKKKAPNEPTDPPWRYRKRGFPQKNEPKQTHRARTSQGQRGYMMWHTRPRVWGVRVEAVPDLLEHAHPPSGVGVAISTATAMERSNTLPQTGPTGGLPASAQ